MKSLLSQTIEMNYQVEIHDHIHSQVQFQKRDNLSNVNVVFKIWSFGTNGCAEMESYFLK